MAASEGKRNQTIVLDNEIYEIVNDMAWEQRRSFSNMTNVLLREALTARGKMEDDKKK